MQIPFCNFCFHFSSSSIKVSTENNITEKSIFLNVFHIFRPNIQVFNSFRDKFLCMLWSNGWVLTFFTHIHFCFSVKDIFLFYLYYMYMQIYSWALNFIPFSKLSLYISLTPYSEDLLIIWNAYFQVSVSLYIYSLDSAGFNTVEHRPFLVKWEGL